MLHKSFVCRYLFITLPHPFCYKYYLLEPLMAKATRFLGSFYYCKNIYQANPVVPTVLIFCFMLFPIFLILR